MSESDKGAWIINRTRELMTMYGWGWSKAMARAADEWRAAYGGK